MSSSSPVGPPPDAALRLRLLHADAWPEAEPAWRQVFEASGSTSFFMGPEWVGAWLSTFGLDLDARVVLLEDAGVPVAAAVLAQAKGRLPLVPARQLHFHTSGEPVLDSPVVEFTSFLARPDRRAAALTAFTSLVQARRWDEFVLSGVTEPALEEFRRAVPAWRVNVEWRPTYSVDLAELRRANTRYETVLSRNSRDQLQRSLKLYRERADLTVDVARTPEEASAFFDELGVLSEQRWQARGFPSAFESLPWRQFHARLIALAFQQGAIQMVRVRAGDATIGVLYNLVHGGVVSFYQSGLRFEPDNRFKPGQVTHALAIQACVDAGHEVYEFMAAEGPEGSRYKASLATQTGRLAWAAFRRKTPRTIAAVAVEEARRRLGRRR
ncbi:MAG: GNAT family N-acetyltransferase [Vicinamibacterales bacterium]